MSEEYEEYPDEYLDENGNPCEAEPEQKRGELKPCPFCGTLPQANAWIFRGISETRYFCPNQECPLSVRTVTLEEWNTRPIEDALNARIAELELRLDVYNGNMYDVVVDELDKANARIAELEAAQRDLREYIDELEAEKECEMRVFKDGNAWCFVLPDFQDLQVSSSVWMKEGVLDKIYKELRSVRNE